MEQRDLSVGTTVRILQPIAARVVSTSTFLPLRRGQVCVVDDYVPEFHEALVGVTSVGPQVWVDLDDLAAAPNG